MGIETEIILGEQKKADLFSRIAEGCARDIKTTDKGFNKDNNKSTQIRKFYDELSMWNDRVQLNRTNREAEFKKQEPFIRMLKAKVAYAEGRKHINNKFSTVFNRCIDQIKNADTLKEAKLFMEAIIAYCKLEETRGEKGE